MPLRHAASLVIAAVSVIVSTVALAAQRTFVSTGGSDSNPCTLTQPCRSFAVAITATDPNGEIVVLDSGGYGSVAVNKGVTISAPPGVYAGISVFSGADGIDITASGKKVVLRGLAINGQGGTLGIAVFAAAEVHLEYCIVSNMNDRGIYISSGGAVFVDHVVVRSNGGNGIEVGPGGADLFVDDTRIATNIFNGIAVTTGHVSLNRVAVEDNSMSGIEVTPSAAADPRLSVRDSVIAGNAGHGVVLVSFAGATARAELEHTSVVRNGSNGVVIQSIGGAVSAHASNINSSNNAADGVLADGATATLTVTGSTMTRNGGYAMEQMNGSTLRSPGNNIVDGNVTGALNGSITSISPM